MSYHPGRPREFTHPKRRELLDHIGQGATVEEAARIVGVSLRTVQREAKHNEFFDHDLHLAVHAAPVDPYKMVTRAARTHWRAAAWLLERTDPDRFAKRPPNSCRPETLMDVSAWLIETALEATAPEQREAVYRRMHAVADKALNVLMPDQHEARRSLAGALPDRPMPLSDHEITKTLRVVQDDSAPEIGAQPAPAGSEHAAPAGGLLRAQTPTANPGTRPSTHIQNFRLLDSEDMDADRRYPLPDDEDAAEEDAGAPATAGRASTDPPNGGIMSPKMSAATEVDATQCEPADVLPVPAVAARRHVGDGITRYKAGDGIAGLKIA